MPEQLLPQLGVGGALVVIILWLVFNFLKQRKKNCGPTIDPVKFEKMYGWTQRLYEMHDKVDQDGVPLWYVRRSMEENIAELTDAINGLREVMLKNLTVMELLEKKLD